MSNLKHLLEHLGHFLPAQGPIGVFIHHNTLHAFQHLPFEEAVVDASRVFGAEPYMAEEQYRAEFRRGRITNRDVAAVVESEPDARVTGGLRRRQLRQAMLLFGTREFSPATVAWRMEEGDLAREFEKRGMQAVFRICDAHAQLPVSLPAEENRRGELEAVVHPWLIRLCANYLDQGMAYWPMPNRDQGFYLAVRRLMVQPGVIFPEGLEGLDEAFRKQESQNWTAEQALLAHLGAPETWEHTLRDELLALPGWPGLFQRLEQEPGLAPHVVLSCSLMDYLAVRMTLTAVARERIQSGAPFRPAPMDAVRLAQAARLYDAAKSVGLQAAEMAQWSAAEWSRFTEEVTSFDSIERRRMWQLAYERHHERNILLGIAAHQNRAEAAPRPLRPVAQVFFCIDEREESMRRALEEVDPMVETHGAAGFFGVAVDYQGIDDAHRVALCPVVVKPQHAILERPAAEDADKLESRRVRRRLLALAARHASVSSRTLVRGALSTAVLGLLSIFPLAARVLVPRTYGKLRDALNRIFLPEPRTELTLMREGHDKVEGLLLGFSVAEKADRVASVLVPAGLTSGFARLVVILGHGSTSLNNPHESAYDCGACGGRRGGPNARLFAAMANHPGVRALLAQRGIDIPQTTWFVGGYHDTCSDDVDLFDLDLAPLTHENDIRAIQQSLDLARARNAHERARRFMSCDTEVSFEEALRHVEERSEHLAQPRAECGHCTNAVAVVGRRALTRNLFLDRRAFLVSYDPVHDNEGENLGKLLGAVVPVCGGINLEYYFSYVDNEKYGCGTKLPHNIVSLMAVMNGHASDLRTGLPRQMVEIHEPVRILFVIESEHEVLEKVIQSNALVREFVVNRWIRVATVHPETRKIHVRRDHGYEPLDAPLPVLPEAPSSAAWYRGQRDHLPLASIVRGGQQ